jgi:hypothetical protein
VGVVAASPVVRQLQQQLDHTATGAFTLRSYPSLSAAHTALVHLDVEGAFAPGPGESRVEVAQAGGPFAAELVQTVFTQIATRSGHKPVVTDVRPLPSRDSRGLSSFLLTIGSVIGALVCGGLLAVLTPPRASRRAVPVLLAFCALGGLVASATAAWVTGALTGAFWPVAGVVSLLALAVSATSYGVGRIFGPPGVGLAALMLVALGMSSSGAAIGLDFVPGFFHAIGPGLPPAAAITALHGVVYFGGASIAGPLEVLGVWAAGGLLATGIAELARIGKTGRVALAVPRRDTAVVVH